MAGLMLLLVIWTAQATDSESEEIEDTSKLYLGTWRSAERFLEFENSQGRSYLAIREDPHKLDEMIMVLFDGDWENYPYVIMSTRSLNLTTTQTLDNNLTEMLWSDARSPEECFLSGFLNLTDSKNSILAQFESQSCGFSFTIEAIEETIEDLRKSGVNYVLFYSCLCALSIFAYVRHAKDCFLSESHARKSAIDMWIMLACIDIFLGLWHLRLAFVKNYAFEYFFLAACWSFGSGLAARGKLLQYIWQAQTPESDSFGPSMQSRLLSQFRNKIYFSILVTILAVIILDFMYLLSIFFLYSFFVPQIWKNAREGNRNSISAKNIHLIALSRTLFLGYMFACPKNILVWEPNTNFAFWICLYVYLQVAVLLYQRYRPRFIIPQSLRPEHYNYYRSAQEEKSMESDNCAICISPLYLQGQSSKDVVKFSRTMHTPCGHCFHEECLNNWVDVKLECPTCRSTLPLVEN